MQYKLGNETLKSRRGDYQLALLDTNPIIWTPKPIDLETQRHRDVSDEITYALIGRLGEHKYWANEPLDWIKAYQDFYIELFKLNWLHERDDRHNIVVSPTCCLTLVQYHNHRLIAYSRSTDMRNGYFSDRLLLNFLAAHIKTVRPALEVKEIVWFIAIPHVYHKEGIARLLDTDEVTK